MRRVVEVSHDALKRVVPFVELEDVSTTRFSGASLDAPPPPEQVENLRLVIRLHETGEVVEVGNGVLVCEVTCVAQGYILSGDDEREDPESDQKIAEIGAVFGVRYRLRDEADCGEAVLKEFAQSNAVYNAWPYWREFLNSALVRLGHPSFTVPTLVVAARREASPQDDSEKRERSP